jgi:TRAP-type C4-dicarboxylate transport system permease small subunit
MNQFLERLDRVLRILLFLILFVMVATVAANVFGRFLLGVSIQWGEEVAKIMLTYLTFFGAAYAMKDNSHYSFDFIIQNLPPGIKPYFRVFRWVIVILISLLLVFWSAEVTLRIRHWIMPSTGISRSLVYGAAPVGVILLMIYAIHHLVNEVKTLVRTKKNQGD